MKLYDELKWRGLIKDEAGEDLEEKTKRWWPNLLYWNRPNR